MLSALAKYIFGGMINDAPETTTMQYETREINDWLLVDMPDQAIDNEDMDSESDEDDILTAVPLLMVEEASMCPRQIVLSYEDNSACDKTYGKIRKIFHDKIHSASSKVQVHSGDKIQGNFVDNNETVSVKFQDNVHSKMQDNSSEVQETSKSKNSRSKKSKPRRFKKSKKQNKSEVVVQNIVGFKESSNQVQDKANNIVQDFNEKCQSTPCKVLVNLDDDDFFNKSKNISIVNETSSFNINQDTCDMFQKNSNFMKTNVQGDFIVNTQESLDQKMQSELFPDQNLHLEAENCFLHSLSSSMMPVISGIYDDCDDEIFFNNVKKITDEINGNSSNKINSSAGEGQGNLDNMQSISSADYNKLCKDENCMDVLKTVSDTLNNKRVDEISIEGKNLVDENNGKCVNGLKNSDDEDSDKLCHQNYDKIQDIYCEFKGNSKKPNSKKYKSKKAKKNRMQNKFSFKFQDPSATILEKCLYSLQQNSNEKLKENLDTAMYIPTDISDSGNLGCLHKETKGESSNKDIVITDMSTDTAPDVCEEFYNDFFENVLENYDEEVQEISKNRKPIFSENQHNVFDSMESNFDEIESFSTDLLKKSNVRMQDIADAENQNKCTYTSNDYDEFERNSSNSQGNLSNIHCILHQINNNLHSEKESNFVNKDRSTEMVDNFQNKYQDSIDLEDNSNDTILENFANFWDIYTKIQVNSEDEVQGTSDNEDFDKEQSNISDEVNEDFDKEQSDISDEVNEYTDKEQSDIPDDLNEDFDKVQYDISDDEINKDFDKQSDSSDDETNEDSGSDDEINEDSGSDDEINEDSGSDDEITEDSEHEVKDDELLRELEDDDIFMRCRRIMQRLNLSYYNSFNFSQQGNDEELDDETFKKKYGVSPSMKKYIPTTKQCTILELKRYSSKVSKHDMVLYLPLTECGLSDFGFEPPCFYGCQYYPSICTLEIAKFCVLHGQYFQECPPSYKKGYYFPEKYEKTLIEENISPSTPLDSSLLIYPTELLQNITNQKYTALPTKTAVVLEHVKQLKPEQQAIQFETRKYLTRSQLNRQNRNYIYQSSVKTNRRRNLQRNHSGANNNRKCC